jgi:hypothetical protein
MWFSDLILRGGENRFDYPEKSKRWLNFLASPSFPGLDMF